jgi:hypothetical protein
MWSRKARREWISAKLIHPLRSPAGGSAQRGEPVRRDAGFTPASALAIVGGQKEDGSRSGAEAQSCPSPATTRPPDLGKGLPASVARYRASASYPVSFAWNAASAGPSSSAREANWTLAGSTGLPPR